MSHFNLISTTKASDVIPVKKYVSEKTGLTVIIAGVEGPLVNGFFCLATEAHDDDGLPHTLEHLIFLGSEKYPYKGILDLLANRCMANGTNAWTDVDHTCYTIYTAGDEGMLTLLPIYLDHILRPTLTDEGFITEVHHIDGDGDNAGVVYCEMQGRENSADSRCNRRLLHAMYPNSGYSAETGGIMENLRISTDNTKVRNFHKKFYRPENLTIILTGLIEPEDVFRALEPVEDDIIAKRETEPQSDWVKPWQTLPPPALYGEITEQWPADTEDCGQVVFGWRGPLLSSPRALKSLTGCAILLRYLCDTPAAPLQRCLVEREDALAGDVSYNLTENIASMIKIELDNVPIEKLQAAKEAALECVRRVRSGAEPLEAGRLVRLVRKQLREATASLEAEPHSALAFPCIADALYSLNEQDFITRLNPQIDLHELLNEPVEYWLGLLQEYFTDDIVIVVGSPSIELQAKMAEEDKKIIENQRSELGESGLAEKAMQLENAIKFNERAPPAGTLAAVEVPRCDRLRRHEISSWSSGGEPCPHFDLTQLPLYARVHHLKTNLVYMNIVLDTSSVSGATRAWVPLVSGALGECGVRRGGALRAHDEVAADTERLTVAFANSIGFGRAGNFSVGIFGDLINIHIRCEPNDYEEVVNHVYDIIYASEITKERLLVFTQRLINDVAQVRRNGSKMVYATLRDSLYSKESNMHWCSVLRQQKFLKELIEQLNAGGDSAETVVAAAKEALKDMTQNVWLHLATDFERYKLSVEPWKKFCNENEIIPKEPSVAWDADSMSGWGDGFVVGVGGVESSFVARLAPGPRARTLAAAPLLVALNYFTQLEGPMWRLIRGNGLSYGYGLNPSPEEGCITFSLYKATNAVAAYTKAKSIVEEFLDNGEFDEDLFLSAKSTALFEVVESEKCPADVVSESLLSYLRRVDLNYNRELVCAIAAVTTESAREAARRWLPTLFDAAVTKMAVVCHPTKVTDVQAAFAKIDVKLEAFESMEVSHFNK